MSKRAVLYARVSGDDRAKTGGENLADQLRLCREYAQKRGYTIVAELAEDDRGASGASFDLPKLSKALQLARAEQFDVFVVRELDRLSRDLAKQLIVEQELKQYGVSIEYVLYDFPDTPEGRLNKNLRAMLAEYEREKIKQRMRRGKLRKIRNGEAINQGHPPFGYRNVEIDGKATLAISEQEAKTVRLIFELYTEGDGERGPMSMRAIAKELSQRRIPTYSDLRRKGDCTRKTVSKRGHWDRSSVGAMLSNETYTGTWYYGRRNWDEEDLIPVPVPVIIDDETWRAAQQRRKRNKREATRNRKHDYLLVGRLTCGRCDRTLIGNPSYSYYKGKRYGPVLYYRCQADRRGYPCTLKGTSFRAEKVDALAWEWVRELMTDEDGLRRSLEQYREQREQLTRPLRERLSVTNTLIEEVADKVDRLLDLYLDGDFDREALNERKTRLEQERDSLRQKKQYLEAQLCEQEFSAERLESILRFASTIRVGIEKAEDDFEKRRQLLDALEVTGEVHLDEDGTKWVEFFCAVGKTERIVSSSSNGAHILDRGSCCR
jgi:site-specific DNA recombinase